MISSAGFVLTNTCGTALDESFLPGTAALTSFQFSSAGSFLKLSGSVPAGVHGAVEARRLQPARSRGADRRSSTCRSSNRSQFVLIAYFRSVPAMGLQIGSPSRLTMTAGVLLKNTAGGSAFTPSTFFGMIWLLSTLASTRSSAITRPCWTMLLVTAVTTSWICGLAERREIGLADPQHREVDEPFGHRNLGIRFRLDRPERRLVSRFGRRRHGGVERHELLVRPARDLRLMDAERRPARSRERSAANRHRASPSRVPLPTPVSRPLAVRSAGPWASRPPCPAAGLRRAHRRRVRRATESDSDSVTMATCSESGRSHLYFLQP